MTRAGAVEGDHAAVTAGECGDAAVGLVAPGRVRWRQQHEPRWRHVDLSDLQNKAIGGKQESGVHHSHNAMIGQQ